MISTVAWFDADDPDTITHVGGVVSGWANKNGNTAYDLSQSTAAKKPSLSTADADYNGRTVMNFTDVSAPHNLVTDGVADTITFAASVAVLESRDPWSVGGSDRPTAYSGRSGSSDVYYDQFADGDKNGVFDGFIAGAHYLDGETSGATPGSRAAELQDGPTLETRDTTFTAKGGICVGADRTIANRAWNGKIAEIVFLPTADRYIIQLVEGYLAWKWGTQADLDSAHPYKTRAPSVDLWTPDNMPTVTWFDAADAATITASGGNVSTWQDKSGNGNHATQGTGTKQPTYSAVDKEVVFNGTTDIMQIANDAYKDLQNFATVALVRRNASYSWGNSVTSWDGESGGNTEGHIMLRQSGSDVTTLNLTARGTSAGGDFSTVTGIATQGENFIGAAYRTLASGRELRFNGSVARTEATARSNISYNGTNRSGLGGSYASDNWASTNNAFLNGALKEVVVIENPTIEQVKIIEGYMAWKWGLQDELHNTHPYKFSPPLVGRAPKPWTPAQLDVQAWYDADAAYTIHEDTTAGRVSQWDDRSGNGNHMTQATSTAEPATGTRTLNGRNALDFDPTSDDQHLSNAAPTVSGREWDIFAVMAIDTVSGSGYLCILNGAGSGQIRGNRYDDYSIGGAYDSGAGFGEAGQAGDTNPHIWNGRVAVSGVRLLIDGTQIYAYTGNRGVVTIDGYIRVGANAFLADGFNGRIAEFILVPHLNDEFRYKVEGYLAHKWGLAANLPAAHPYKNHAPLTWL